jgi:hypothetical protein
MKWRALTSPERAPRGSAGKVERVIHGCVRVGCADTYLGIVGTGRGKV